MDKDSLKDAALAIRLQIEKMGEKGMTEWGTPAIAEQVNKLLEAAGPLVGSENAGLLPTKFKWEPGHMACNARYVDIAAACQTIGALLR